MYQSYLRNYLRMVVALDENVGRVLDYLDRTGLATNTIVIYTSDNGFFLGEHGFYNKMWMYEDGFQIPLIIRLPGNHGGRINPEIVSMMDIAPTILDLCGAREIADGGPTPEEIFCESERRAALLQAIERLPEEPEDRGFASGVERSH